MTIQVDGQPKRLGLALSGGGFRAAAFHLGAMERLDALGLLECVDLFSCVSGGSIAGASVVGSWGEPGKLAALENYLTTRSIAARSFVVGVLDPFSTRLEVLAEAYADDLFGARTLADFAGPRIYLNATNMATGNLFAFVSGGGGPAELGEHELGYDTADGIRIADAVAASSAFPPVFPPLRLDPARYPRGAATGYVTLTDGGVYDNLGVNPLFLERNALDYAIVSDGGKPLDIQESPTELGSGVLKEAIGILMEQVRGLQFRRLELAHQAGAGPKPVWFSIDSEEGERSPGDAVFAAGIRTHLKKLAPVEIEVLKRHGGALVEARLRRYAPELIEAAGG